MKTNNSFIILFGQLPPSYIGRAFLVSLFNSPRFRNNRNLGDAQTSLRGQLL